jgi:hypothetical protein
MRPLSAQELLDAWERGLNEPSAARTLGLLAAGAETSRDAVATLSIGERDRRLLTLREWTFGPLLVSVAACVKCGERLEWTADVGDLRVASEPVASGELSIRSAGYSVRFRLPNSLDLTAAAGCPDVAAARRVLLERCVLGVELNDLEIPSIDLPSEVAEAVGSRMSETDPQADTHFDVSCPSCGHRWTVLFDIESYFWSELSAWAQRVLQDVHTLASAYGWRETDILRLGDWRRQFYLNLIGA